MTSVPSSDGIAGPKLISTRVPTGSLTGFTLDDRRRAVALRAKHDPPVAGDDDERARRGENSAGDDAQAVAERAARRQPQQLGRDHRAGDAEQAGDLFRRAVDPGAVVLDEVAALGQLADADLRAAVERRCRPAPSAPAGAACPSRTPAFCCSPSTVRKSVQSSRSNFKFWGAGELANPASGISKIVFGASAHDATSPRGDGGGGRRLIREHAERVASSASNASKPSLPRGHRCGRCRHSAVVDGSAGWMREVAYWYLLLRQQRKPARGSARLTGCGPSRFASLALTRPPAARRL